MWEPQVEPIVSSGRRAFLYDIRGHGRSGVPAKGYRVVDFADEAIGLLDALAIDRAHIVGLSLGGSVVARVAVRHPDRIRSVTIIGSMASGYPGLTEFIRQGGTAAMVMDGRMDLETSTAPASGLVPVRADARRPGWLGPAARESFSRRCRRRRS